MRFIGLFDVKVAEVAACVGLGVSFEGGRVRAGVFVRGVEGFGTGAVGTEYVHCRV
jgi:hypothetical protein